MTIKQLNQKTQKVKRAYDDFRRKQGERAWMTSDYAEALVGDVGDLMKLVVKRRRKGASKAINRDIGKELADCLYMIMAMAQELDIDLEEEYKVNLEFLEQNLKELKEK